MSLESGMRKAYEDTELLRAIILPLEEQIQALKDKLRQTDHHLNESEKMQTKLVLGVEGLVKWLDGKTYEEAVMHLDNRQKQLLSFSELKQREEVEDECDINYSTEENISGEKTNETSPEIKDTRIFISFLYTRIALLQKELHATKNEHSHHLILSDKARKTNTELRKQLYNANSEVIRMQKNHLSELNRVSSVLSEDQKSQLSTLKVKDNEHDVDGVQQPISNSEENIDEERLITVDKTEWHSLQTELNKIRALLGVGVGDNLVGGQKFRELQVR